MTTKFVSFGAIPGFLACTLFSVQLTVPSRKGVHVLDDVTCTSLDEALKTIEEKTPWLKVAGKEASLTLWGLVRHKDGERVVEEELILGFVHE